MKEIYPNIFKKVIEFKDKHALPRNIYIIKQPERSLMIDTTYRFEHALKEINQMIAELDIDYKKLDIFITHNHPDHVGYVHEMQQLGATIYMNPEEADVKTDIIQCYLSKDTSEYVNLRSMGVTKERYPEEYDTLVMNLSRKLVEREEPYRFQYIPVRPGDKLDYKEYHFEVVSLKGHTIGQCGLYEREKKILFCGDQIVKNTIPIVVSQKRNLHLLKQYLDSLKDMKVKYQDCCILSCHNETIYDINAEANIIIESYEKQCEKTLLILKDHGEWMVTRDLGVQVYGGRYMASDYKKVTLCTHIWSKTFVCLEYLFEQKKVECKEEDGVIYWKARE